MTTRATTPSSGDVATATATFELDPGETVTCVFVNVMDGSITIIKDADPEDGTDFDFTDHRRRPQRLHAGRRR